jgi:signal transduction histidine kinase
VARGIAFVPRSKRHHRSIGRRLTIAYASLVLASAVAVIASVYWAAANWFERRVDESLSSEFDNLVDYHQREGPRSLTLEIERRISQPGKDGYVYFYAERRYQRIVGNVAGWPEGLTPGAHDRRLSLDVKRGSGEVRRRVEIESRALPDGRNLLVGRDVTDDEQFMRTLVGAMTGGLALAALLAIGGGISMSRRLLGRIEGMNDNVLDILGGRAKTRVPFSEPGDEFDELARHFNVLLDENDRLIRRMREVTDDVAHDLRTPLARIRTRIETALTSDVDDPRAAETFHELLGETNRIIDTFNALIHIATIESHSLRDEMADVPLDEVVRDAVDLYRPLVEESGVELVDRTVDRISVHGNRHLLSQAVANLLDNAIKYSADRGAIEVVARRSDGRAELVVRDRGPGIPAADRAHVLERFVRLDASRGLPGNGLGLSFVAAVAEHHGAELELSDADPGLRVRLRFPASQRPAPTGVE